MDSSDTFGMEYAENIKEHLEIKSQGSTKGLKEQDNEKHKAQ
jgi:hypothetical protein